MVHACNPSPLEADAGGYLWIQGQLGIHNKHQASQSHIAGLNFKKIIKVLLNLWTKVLKHMLLEKKNPLREKKQKKNETISLIHSGVEKGEWDGEGKFKSPKQSVTH